ncbi:hypothetical protein FRC18_009057 [Serendipita sp. 400]|nr:hypothetical protein FRC18_009057 [Serendipita sp. 400]
MQLSPHLFRTLRTRLPTSTRLALNTTRRILPTVVIIGSTSSSLHSAMSTDAQNNAPRVQKTEDEWRAILSPEQFRVLRERGTERAGTGEYEHTKDDGTCFIPIFRTENDTDMYYRGI